MGSQIRKNGAFPDKGKQPKSFKDLTG